MTFTRSFGMVTTVVSAFVISQIAAQADVPDYKDSNHKELLQWEAPVAMQKEYPYYLSGFDNDNSPVWVAELGRWDTRKNVEMGPEREKLFKNYVLQMLHRMVESVKLRSTDDDPVTEFIIVVDMEGYTVRQSSSPQALTLALWMARQFEQAFRDSMKFGYIVNGNFVFTTVWQLMRPILGENVFKLEISGSNKERWVPALLKNIPKSQLPAWYGGIKSHKPLQVYG